MFEGKLKAVTFSFDDGITQDIKLIDLLNKYNLKGTFNLNSELLGKPGLLERENQKISHYKIVPSDVQKIYEGHEVAVHTLTHRNLTELSREDIINQVEQDRINLENLVGYDVVGMAYPCGHINNNDYVADLIRTETKIKYARTITDTDSFNERENPYRFNPNVNGITEHKRLMELAERFVNTETKEPMIFYIWGHSYELDFGLENTVLFEEFLKFISNRPDIFYGTNREVLLS